MSFSRRVDVPELMDDPSCPVEEVHEALVFLGWLNRVSLARRILARDARPGRVLDVATGGADIPAYLKRRGVARWAVGVDNNPTILGVAGRLSPEVVRVRADGFQLPFADKSFDTAVCHLFFHHLTESQCVDLVRELDRVARSVLVFDLSRSRWLYGVVWLLTRLWGNRLTRHDGPLSVRRSFTVSEVRKLITQAGIPVQVRRHPFWRWSLRMG